MQNNFPIRKKTKDFTDYPLIKVSSVQIISLPRSLNISASGYQLFVSSKNADIFSGEIAPKYVENHFMSDPSHAGDVIVHRGAQWKFVSDPGYFMRLSSREKNITSQVRKHIGNYLDRLVSYEGSTITPHLLLPGWNAFDKLEYIIPDTSAGLEFWNETIPDPCNIHLFIDRAKIRKGCYKSSARVQGLEVAVVRYKGREEKAHK